MSLCIAPRLGLGLALALALGREVQEEVSCNKAPEDIFREFVLPSVDISYKYCTA
jgi:hypothetical protein